MKRLLLFLSILLSGALSAQVYDSAGFVKVKPIIQYRDTGSTKIVYRDTGSTKFIYRDTGSTKYVTVYRDTCTTTTPPPVEPPPTTPSTGSKLYGFTSTPITTDFSRPAAGAEQWHDRNDVNFGFPAQDVYYRFVATRIATNTRGVYNWSYFDGLVNAAINKGQKFSFGIMTVYPDGSTNEGLVAFDGGTACYPQWLHNLMQSESVKDWRTGSTWTPNYNSNHYLSWLLELNTAINAHIEATSFNGVRYKDVINIIDIRGYGAWGEWHSAYTPNNNISDYPAGTFPTVSSLKRIVDAYVQGFPNFQLVAMIAAFDANWLNNTKNPPEIAHYILTHKGNNRGPIGWRRDQWGALDGYLKSYLEDNTRSFNGLVFRDSIMTRWKRAPITGEPPAWNPNEYGDLERQIRLYHASSFGNGNYGGLGGQSVTRVKAAAAAAGFRLGYGNGSVTVNGSTITIAMNWVNTGIAPTYEHWNVVYELVDASGAVKVSYTSVFKPRLFKPGDFGSVTDTYSIPASVPRGTYKVNVKVIDPNGYRKPMPLAVQATAGDYTLTTINY